LPALAARAFVVSQLLARRIHVTGWKVGTVVAPEALTAEFRKVHQFNVFTVNTPVQHGAGALPWPTPHPTSNLAAVLPAQTRPLSRAGWHGTRLKRAGQPGQLFSDSWITAP
jgi:methionine aminotransferase